MKSTTLRLLILNLALYMVAFHRRSAPKAIVPPASQLGPDACEKMKAKLRLELNELHSEVTALRLKKQRLADINGSTGQVYRHVIPESNHKAENVAGDFFAFLNADKDDMYTSRVMEFPDSYNIGGVLSEKWDEKEPLKTCQTVSVVHLSHKVPNQCLVAVSHSELKTAVRNAYNYRLDALKPVVPPRAMRIQEKAIETIPFKDQPWLFNHMAREALARLFHHKDDILHELLPLLTPRARNKTLTVMMGNEGLLNLFINWACSVKRNVGDFALRSTVFFATSANAKKTLDLAFEKLGFDILVFYHTGFGEISESHAAPIFGSELYKKFYWWKLVIPWVVLECNFNVLFHDVDIVWYKDPYELMLSNEMAEFDTVWMDDSSRRGGYLPFGANAGCYFMRFNPQTVHFQRRVTWALEDTVDWDDQITNNHYLGENHASFELSVKMLPWQVFPSGVQLFNTERMASLDNGKWKPVLFHMNWTGNNTHKWQHVMAHPGTLLFVQEHPDLAKPGLHLPQCRS
jgi:hypothetical protein